MEGRLLKSLPTLERSEMLIQFQALAAGGPSWGVLAGSLLAYDFASRAIPVMDEYCSKRYGADWVQVKRKVPYKLLPFVY